LSNKHKKRSSDHPSLADIKGRIERALTEGRSQQALDLARQLYKRERIPEYQELVKKASLARARHLHEQGYSQDAITLLENAQQLDPGNPSWLRSLAELLARCGATQQALTLVQSLAEGADRTRVLAHAVDAAVPKQSAGRALLPPALQPEFDRVLQAFREVEAGQDEQARTTLQTIGLRSPFLEWKLLLRGLQAYYQHDDPRALENWQRLDAERLPARLAAPFRCQIDPAFRAAQAPATQAALNKQVERLQNSTLVQQLRLLRTATANKSGLPAAFRQLDTLLPAVRQQAPHLVPRLARFFYWAMIKTGPDDILRYRRVFGAPPDDPNFHRLSAVALEDGGDLTRAHEFWQRYEKDVAGFPWPAEEIKRARALIWLRMGENAQSIPSKKKLARLPPFLRDHPDRPQPLNPPAEKCFQKSLELAPDLLNAHEALFLHEIIEDRPASALKAGEALLQKHPDHVPTLEGMARLYQEKGKQDEALAFLERALKNNPLNRQLRAEFSTAHMQCARSAVEASRFDKARQHYQTALDFDDRQDHSSILCKQAGCEFKAGETTRAEELLEQARTQSLSAVAIAYRMLIEVGRLKLDKTLKKRFEKDFNDGLANPPTAVDVVELVETASHHFQAHVEYTGSKTHTKKVLSWAEKARTKVQFSEEQLERVCQALIGAKAGKRSIQGYLRQGYVKFRTNPAFHILDLENEVQGGPDRFAPFNLAFSLAEAERLTRDLPEGPRKADLLRRVEKLKNLIGAIDSLAGMPFPPFFEDFDPFDDWEDDDEG